ncbi:hypothetical protein D3C87_1959710 [compost metagenome]
MLACAGKHIIADYIICRGAGFKMKGPPLGEDIVGDGRIVNSVAVKGIVRAFNIVAVYHQIFVVRIQVKYGISGAAGGKITVLDFNILHSAYSGGVAVTRLR